MAEDDAGGLELERAAEAARADAYDAVYEWNGKELQAWSIGREQLYFRLRAADAALPLEKAIQHPETFLGDAMKLLYLCSHEPEEWRRLRLDLGAFLEAIEVWAERAVPRARQSQAVELALRILNDAQRTLAVPEPTTRRTREPEGN